jgi:D-proline reductase (dithiol) PrdB
MPIDSFRWLPGAIAAYYRGLPFQKVEPIPWTPLAKPVERCRFALVTTAGLYMKDRDPPFDLDGERRKPFWGDPTYRVIPREARRDQIGVAHLHINPADLLADMNVALPVQRILELEAAGKIGSLAPSSYSFMGYQPDNSEWENRYAPEVARRMKEEGVEAALLTPT